MRNLVHVAVDFEHDDICRALGAAGVDLERPVTANWLGVSHYLSAEAILRMFRAFGRFASGSEIVMDYMRLATDVPPEAALRRAALLRLTNEGGEPLIGHLASEDIVAYAERCGLAVVADAGPEERDALLDGRRDALALLRGRSPNTRVATLVVRRRL